MSPQSYDVWFLRNRARQTELPDRIACHFGPFFELLPHYQSEKSKFRKNEKSAWRYDHFTHVYNK